LSVFPYLDYYIQQRFDRNILASLFSYDDYTRFVSTLPALNNITRDKIINIINNPIPLSLLSKINDVYPLANLILISYGYISPEEYDMIYDSYIHNFRFIVLPVNISLLNKYDRIRRK
jgi:tagatose-1,6-bisphosphate aldolase non-catalytic subunit AgaZ/GatZ